MKKYPKNYKKGLTLFEVVVYLSLASVFLSVALPTSMNILSLTNAQQIRSENDQQFITLMHSVEGLIRTGQSQDVAHLVTQYQDIMSSSSLHTIVNSETGEQVLSISFLYHSQMYSYVYVY